MFDLEEFTVAMNEMGLDLTVSPSQGSITIELSLKNQNKVVGVVREKSIEYGVARLLRQLAISKITLNNLTCEKLSVL